MRTSNGEHSCLCAYISHVCAIETITNYTKSNQHIFSKIEKIINELNLKQDFGNWKCCQKMWELKLKKRTPTYGIIIDIAML